MTRRLLPFLFILFTLGVILFASSEAVASPYPQGNATVTPQATPTFDMARLNRPPTVIPVGQVDEGAQYYWGVCMACHGDRGQGLTEEWKDAFGPEDRDCWHSECHGPDHPPQGFEIPKDSPAPAIAGPGTIAAYANAFELHNYILETMPCWFTQTLL